MREIYKNQYQYQFINPRFKYMQSNLVQLKRDRSESFQYPAYERWSENVTTFTSSLDGGNIIKCVPSAAILRKTLILTERLWEVRCLWPLLMGGSVAEAAYNMECNKRPLTQLSTGNPRRPRPLDVVIGQELCPLPLSPALGRAEWLTARQRREARPASGQVRRPLALSAPGLCLLSAASGFVSRCGLW